MNIGLLQAKVPIDPLPEIVRMNLQEDVRLSSITESTAVLYRSTCQDSSSADCNTSRAVSGAAYLSGIALPN